MGRKGGVQGVREVQSPPPSWPRPVGAGLGVALHTVLSTWGSHISLGQVPSLRLDKQGVSIAYQSSRDNPDLAAEPLIPIRIEGENDINVGLADGRNVGLSLKDPELVDLILNLLPRDMKNHVNNLNLKMDKFVFLRVLLTYLQNASNNFIN